MTIAVPMVQAAPALDPSASAAGWPAQTPLTLRWDVAHASTASEGTTVRVASDGKYLYVRFDVVQHEGIVATQRSDDTVAGGSVSAISGNSGGSITWPDDAVWVDLWPQGPSGFQYQFETNPNGAHNEASSENASFAPEWSSRAVRTLDGYAVTMAIPLAAIHGAHAGDWRAQFIRYTRSTGALDVWSYDGAQTVPDDPARAGALTFTIVDRPPVPKPRVGVYGLGAVASASAGGSTSRIGADFSVPVTQTASFFGTLHPDYSNVEVDQQTISPSVYQRSFTETRPFFTQAASFYNNFPCYLCGSRSTLYTFGIPTPSQGYAFEGRDGAFGLAAFDAIGSGRTDSAEVIEYTSANNHWNASLQHVGVDLPGIVDTSNQTGVTWWDGKYFSAYTSYALESGTNVSSPEQGALAVGGLQWETQDTLIDATATKVGDQFNPIDGFNSHAGIAGYVVGADHLWTFQPRDALSSIGIGSVIDRYQGVSLGQAQSDNSVSLDVLTKSSIDLLLNSGSNYWRFGESLTPISQSAGFTLTYHSGMQNSPVAWPFRGTSATPTSIQYTTGRYGLGRLDTWFRNSTVRIGDRGLLTFTIDNTSQWLSRTSDNIQWFEGISYAYQIDAASSLALGVRRVIGSPPQPNGGGDCEGTCTNVSLAYHLRLRHEEIYVAYGNPNTLETVPQAIFKIIFYAGTTKGT